VPIASKRTSDLTISTIVTSYARPDALRGCLAGLARQERLADEVVVVVRPTDEATAAVVDEQSQSIPGLRQATVEQQGLVAALNAGLAAAHGDIVAITDDDAVPRPDWLDRIERAFADERVAGVGGRDWVRYGERLVTGREEALAAKLLPGRRDDPTVGKLQMIGRLTGNHHAGIGPPRHVDVLKGVNMSYRRALIYPPGFDTRLRGRGSQVNNEVGTCLRLRRQGHLIVYDPAIAVDHYPRDRPEGDHREDPQPQAIADAVHNETLGIIENVSAPQRALFAVWALLIGSSAAPGVMQIPRYVAQRRRKPVTYVRASLRGRIEGWRTFRGGRT
jgi:glycosyltransferase involved in cell wall biosynthesis